MTDTIGSVQRRVDALEHDDSGAELLIGRQYGDGLVECDGRSMTRRQFEQMAEQRGMKPLLVHYVNDWRQEK